MIFSNFKGLFQTKQFYDFWFMHFSQLIITVAMVPITDKDQDFFPQLHEVLLYGVAQIVKKNMLEMFFCELRCVKVQMDMF